MTAIELPALLYTRKYSIGYAQQLLRAGGLAPVISAEKIKISSRSSEDCLVIGDGERIVVTTKSKLTRPHGVDGVLRSLGQGKYKWLSHKILEAVTCPT